MTRQRTGSGVQSLERGLEILERAARAPEGLGVRALAAEMGLKPPTVHNLLRTLAGRGYLARVEPPVRYRLGPALQAFEGRRGGGDLRLAAAVELKALHARHPEAVFTLAEGSAEATVVVLRVSPEAPGEVRRPAAHVLSAYGSASSLLFQAFWSAEQRGAFALRHPFWEEGAALWRRPEALAAFLGRARRTDVVITRFPGEALVKIAVPVHGADGTPVASLGIAAPAGAWTPAGQRRVVAELKAAARRMEQAARPA